MSCSLGESSTTMRRRAWKTRGKRGSALNKGMPIYDQMSGWRVKLERQPLVTIRKRGVTPVKSRTWERFRIVTYKTWDFRPCGFGESPDEAPLVKELFATYLYSTTKNAAKTPQINKRNRLPLSALRCHRDRLSITILAPFLAVAYIRREMRAIDSSHGEPIHCLQ